LRRGIIAFGSGLLLTLGVVWASHQGSDDRRNGRQVTPLDLSAACVQRNGPTAVAYFGGSTAPTQWHCAHISDKGWAAEPISPEEGCRLLYGNRSRAERAASTSPFLWVCRR
jgi:hypothetical protein